jgi:hypothetical protein
VPKGGVEPPFRVYESLVLAVELLRRTCILTYFMEKYSSRWRFHDISICMWNTLLAVNGIIWIFTSIYFIYSIGYAILRLSFHQFLLGLGLFLLSILIEIILAGLSK